MREDYYMGIVGRGTYPKGEARRKQILDAALNIVAVEGFDQTTLSKISQVVGITEAGVLHYFDSIEDLLVQVLQHKDAAERQAHDFLHTDYDDPSCSIDADHRKAILDSTLEIVDHNAQTPGLVELYAHMAVKASEKTSCAHGYFEPRGEVERNMVAGLVAAIIKSQHIPVVAPPEDIARILLALLDGLQIQWMPEHDIDMVQIVQNTILAIFTDGPTSNATQADETVAQHATTAACAIAPLANNAHIDVQS